MILPIDQDIPIGDIMRYSMYQHGYNDYGRAMRFFSRLPDQVKANFITADYTTAEKCCPQQIPITKIINTIHADLL